MTCTEIFVCEAVGGTQTKARAFVRLRGLVANVCRGWVPLRGAGVFTQREAPGTITGEAVGTSGGSITAPMEEQVVLSTEQAKDVILQQCH